MRKDALLNIARNVISKWSDETLTISTPEKVALSFGMTAGDAHKLLTTERAKRGQWDA